MVAEEKRKQKISVSISPRNIEKIDKIKKGNAKETTSSIVDYSLDISLEEIASLLKNPIELEEQILQLRLKDIQKIKEGGKTKVS